MQDARAIAAQLVDIRNVGTQKVVKLTIHAPQEQAMQIMKLFGWPTGVDPVPVALARLNEEPRGGDAHVSGTQNVDTPPAPQTARAGRERRSWNELSAAEQAGIRCAEESFQRFLSESFPDCWKRAKLNDGDTLEARAAAVVRVACGVKSRSEINRKNLDALAVWSDLDSDYRLWMMVPA